AGMVPEPDPRRSSDDRAGVELALAADVEQLHPEGDGGTEPGEEERRGGDERLVQRCFAAKAGVEKPGERVAGRMMGREQHERHHPERDHDRAERHREREPPRLRQPTLEADHAEPPAISRPISSTVASPASRSPTILPSYITATRSASARISSRSSEMR